jgi:hypothetical protein
MHIRLWLYVILLAIAGTCQVVRLDSSRQTGRLEVTVFDSFGDPLSGTEISIERIINGQPGKRLPFNPGIPLEFGTYKLTISRSAFSPETHIVEVASHFQVLVAGLRPAEVEGHAVYAVRGRIADPERYRDCRIIRLVPLLSHGDPIEASLYQGGFGLEGVRPGRYTAVVLGPKGICSLSDVTIGLYQSKDIVIGGESGQNGPGTR